MTAPQPPDLSERLAQMEAETERLRGGRDQAWQDRELWQLLEAAGPKLRDELIAAWNARDRARDKAAALRAAIERALVAFTGHGVTPMYQMRDILRAALVSVPEPTEETHADRT